MTTVNISNTVSGTSDSTIRTAVVNSATASLDNLSSQFDHVMLCLPPGTSGSWIAYAYVNSWLSVYNNQWCNYVSGQMHGKYNVIFFHDSNIRNIEIGHNLNLAHSGETSTYDDQTGMVSIFQLHVCIATNLKTLNN